MKAERDAARNVFWFDGQDGAHYPSLSEDIAVDVAIIGGGMASLHCAWALRNQGLRIVILEARKIGQQATGRSTAKVTSQHGQCYARLAKDFGEEHARLHAQENEKALRLIAELSSSIGESAGFEAQDAFIYATDDQQAKQLEQEAKAARAAGINAVIETEVEAPIQAVSALRFREQAQFDPFGYLQGLARLLGGDAGIYEQSRVESVEYGEPCRLSVNGKTVSARHVVVTTQMPVVPQGHFFAKAFPFAHVAAAAPLPGHRAFHGMFISAGSPSHSFRTASRGGQTFIVAAGSEYRPGEPDQQRKAVDDLRAFLKEHFDVTEPAYLWSNEDFRPMDGVAFIGPADKRHPNLLVATGFAAWGLTQGVVAGELLAASVLGKDHPAASLYDATRHKPLTGGVEFLKENTKAGMHLVGDRLLGRKNVSLHDIVPGEGGVVVLDGEKLAVRRDPSGQVFALDAICTHLGCVVDWNETDRTWDCPCHGSRFDETGTVLAGPATSPLKPRRIAADGKGGR